MGFKIGIDVGGTFTDFLLTDNDGNKSIYKALTTPHDPSEGLFNGIERIAHEKGMSTKKFLENIDTVVHGTTITTNAVLTASGAETGFITTKGFRDVLNMRRGLKESQYDLKYSPPPPLVPRHLVKTVNERINCDGEVVVPLDEQDVYGAVEEFKRKNVRAVGVSLLFSFVNPPHERRVGEILKAELPDVYVSLSCEVLPQIRAYERHSTTALNAYVGPILSDYLGALEERLRSQDFRGVLLTMQSNGGVMSLEVAQRFAGNTLLSGPAGGPTAGGFYAQPLGLSNFITVDMGGTSFDACLVVANEPDITTEGKIGGHQVAFPMLNIHTIGAGGGSIAWIDEGGLLQVGPRSAGADPGPVCYDKGGNEPTVTDADLLLGYLDPDAFFGGKFTLNAELARKLLKEKIADHLNLDTVEAANGIYRIINTKMADALRVVSVEKGYDPREFALIVAGGAGPIHAGMIAREMEIPVIIVPRESSVFCAAGMLFSNLKHDLVRTHTKAFDTLNIEEVCMRFEEMESVARSTLEDEGIPEERVRITCLADIHYVGQFNEVTVPVSYEEVLKEIHLDRIIEDFHKRHDQLYGYALPEAAVEMTNLRLTGQGITDKPSFAEAVRLSSNVAAALKGHREAFFEDGFKKVPVYDGLKMGFGHCVDGPCIIEQPTTTIIVPREYTVGCDKYNSYVMFHVEFAPDDIKKSFGRG